MRLVGKFWIVVACAVLLVACGSEDTPDVVNAPASPAAGTPPADAPAMTIGPITWAESVDAETGESVDVVTSFTPESTAIIAVIEVENVPNGTEFFATWMINGQPIDVGEMDITANEDLPHAWISFGFHRDEGQRYPIGQLSVAITSSEGDIREGSVEIGFP